MNTATQQQLTDCDSAGTLLHLVQPVQNIPLRAESSVALKKNLLLSAIACVFPNVAWALPDSGQVVAGSSTITSPDANTMVINQYTDQSIINWQRFSIAGDEYVQFIQPSSSSISLNRVTGGDPSSILGSLSANGQVFLVNPNGIYFGQNVRVDVSGLVASVMDIDDDDFLAGNFVFSRDPAASVGSVINDGVITARENGYVVLMGDYAANNGIIQAHMGEVVLASGSHVTLDVSGNNLVSVMVDEATVAELAGVDNTGEIYADGGRVIMTAKVANDLIGSVVNNDGIVQANSIAEHDGAIFLTASGGDITNSGTLDASAAAGSGVDGGGVLVYSDRNVTLEDGAIIRATGDDVDRRSRNHGASGGTVRVIAEDKLDHQSGASIDVSGTEGKGGFVELSGHGGLAIRGIVDLGSGGSLLIDPAVLNIQAGSSVGVSTASTYYVGDIFIENQLNLNNNVTLVASSSINVSGFVNIGATGAGDLAMKIGTLAAGGTLGGANCNSAGVCLDGGSFAFTPDANGSLNLANLSVNIGGGLTLAGGTAVGDVSIGFITTGGNVSITSGGNITVSGGVDSTSAAGVTNFFASAGIDININGDFGSTDVGAHNANVTLNAGRHINIDGDFLLANNSLIMAADNDGNGSGDVNIAGTYGFKNTVSTGGNISVSGNNFNVVGATAPSFAFATDSGVYIQASNIDVNLSGDMNVSAGVFPPTTAVSSGIASVSVSVTAGNDITINANSLNVKGGQADGSTMFGGPIPLVIDANATLSAGRDISMTLAGGLNVLAGTANALGVDSSASVHVKADASVIAGRDILINNVGTNMSVVGGNALASRATSFSASCFNGCDITANANANVTAAGNVVVTSVGGNLDVKGGLAMANGSSLSMTYVGTMANVAANAGGAISANQVTVNTIGGNLSVIGGSAAAYASHSVGTGSSPVVETAKANADASIMATQNIEITNVSGGLTVAGGSALANATRSCDVGACSAVASANAEIAAGQALTVAMVGGSLNVSGGFADAVAGFGVSGTASTAMASAFASAKLDAGGALSINAAGSISVAPGTASSSATSSPPNSTQAIAASAVKSQGNMSLTAGTSMTLSGDIDVGGSSLQLAAGTDLIINTDLGLPGGTAARALAATLPLNADTSLSAGNSIFLYGNIYTPNNSLSMIAGTDIFADFSQIMASGMYMRAGNNIDLSTADLFVGTGTVPGVTGDALVLQALQASGVTLPASSDPNLKLEAGNILDVRSIDLQGTSSYLWLSASDTTVGSISVAPGSNLLLQYSPSDPTATIGFEDLPDIGQAVNYNNQQHVAPFPITTLVIGSSLHTGNIVIGANDMIDIGSKNILAATLGGSIDSLDNVITTGIVASLQQSVFVTPRLDDISVDVGDDDFIDEEEKRKKLISQGEDDESSNEMCAGQ